MIGSTNFTTITERPGIGASADQLRILQTRYRFAAEHSHGREVLEVACGAGVGLGLIAQVANSVTAGDIEPDNCRLAKETYAGHSKITIGLIAAEALPFPDDSFDIVILFEAIYYFRDASEFFREALRVLRPSGTLLISSVNRRWHGFNRSPFSTTYYDPFEMTELLKGCGIGARVFVGFPDDDHGVLRLLVRHLRSVAASLHLIPRTMKGKEILKRLFYGKLTSIPATLSNAIEVEPLVPFGDNVRLEQFRFFYVVASAID